MAADTGVLTFAGVSASLWGANGLPGDVARSIPLDELHPFARADTLNGLDLQHLELPEPPRERPTPEPGVLRWPRDASRWATCYLVVPGDDLAAIRAAVASDGSSTLAIGDGASGYAITATMFLLSVRPLMTVQNPGVLFPEPPTSTTTATSTTTSSTTSTTTTTPAPATQDLYLLTLVDKRWWWWFRPVTIQRNTSALFTWTALIDHIAAALGESVVVDGPIEAAYLKPTQRWAVNAAPACVMLDAVATAINRRVVRKLDGTVVLQSWARAAHEAEDQYRTYSAATVASAGVPAVADSDRTGGGRLWMSDVYRSVPASLDVVFGKGVDGEAVPLGAYPITEALTAVAPPQYGTFAGISGKTGRFTADQFAIWPTTESGDPTNLADLQALAVQAASDWYGWRLTDQDAQFAGVVPLVPAAWWDEVRWSFAATSKSVTTRCVAPPLWNPNTYGYFVGPVTSATTTTTTTTPGSCSGTGEWAATEVSGRAVREVPSGSFQLCNENYGCVTCVGNSSYVIYDYAGYEYELISQSCTTGCVPDVPGWCPEDAPPCADCGSDPHGPSVTTPCVARTTGTTASCTTTRIVDTCTPPIQSLTGGYGVCVWNGSAWSLASCLCCNFSCATCPTDPPADPCDCVVQVGCGETPDPYFCVVPVDADCTDTDQMTCLPESQICGEFIKCGGPYFTQVQCDAACPFVFTTTTTTTTTTSTTTGTTTTCIGGGASGCVFLAVWVWDNTNLEWMQVRCDCTQAACDALFPAGEPPEYCTSYVACCNPSTTTTSTTTTTTSTTTTGTSSTTTTTVTTATTTTSTTTAAPQYYCWDCGGGSIRCGTTDPCGGGGVQVGGPYATVTQCVESPCSDSDQVYCWDCGGGIKLCGSTSPCFGSGTIQSGPYPDVPTCGGSCS